MAGEDAKALMPEIQEIPEDELAAMEAVDEEAEEGQESEEEEQEGEAGTTPATTPTEGEEGETTPPDADAVRLATEAELYRNLEAEYRQDPVSYAATVIKSLTPAQQAALGITAPAAEKPGVPEEGWEDAELTAPELFVKANRDIIQELPQYAGMVNKRLETHEYNLINNVNQVAALTAQVEALAELLEIKFPQAAFKGVDAAAHKAYADEAKKVVNGKKAASKPVPRTPMGEGSLPRAAVKPGELPKGASLVDMFRLVEKASR